jgi:nicotinamidase-related amidase
MTSRALVVVDVQNEYVSGKMRITYPNVYESLANVGRAMDAAARHHYPIAVIQHRGGSDSPIFAADSDGYALCDVVAERHFDLQLDKEMPSSFTDTGLDAWLRARDVDTIVVVGFMTQLCVESTIRDAVHRGFDVEFLDDAAGTLSLANQVGKRSAEEIHETVKVVLQSEFAAVTTTGAWIEDIDAGRTPARSNIVESSRA